MSEVPLYRRGLRPGCIEVWRAVNLTRFQEGRKRPLAAERWCFIDMRVITCAPPHPPPGG